MMKISIALAFVCTLLLVGPAQAENRRIVVMPVQADSSIRTQMGETLDEFVMTQVYESSGLEVFGSADIAAVMELDSQKNMLGCDDTSCLAEIAGALGAELLFVMSVGDAGARWAVNAKLIDVQAA